MSSTGVRPRVTASPRKQPPPPLTTTTSNNASTTIRRPISARKLNTVYKTNAIHHKNHSFWFLRPAFLVRLVLFAVVAVCSVSLAIRLHAVAIQGVSTKSTTTSNNNYKSHRVLFQPNPVHLLSWDTISKQVHRQLLMSEVGYQTRPRVFAAFWPKDYDEDSKDNPQSSSTTTTDSKINLQYRRMDPNLILPLTDRNIYLSMEAVKAQLHLENSKDYDNGAADPFEEGDCTRQYDWQLTSYPTCNDLHEHPLWDMHTSRGSNVKFLASGYWRDTWMVRDGEWQPHALKTIRYMHDYEPRNYDRHRRDAVAMERMTASPNVVSIYGFCGNSGMFEFADGGSLEDAIWYSDEPEWNATEKLIVAYQAVSGLADLHNVDVEGRASIAHTDIVPSQFVFVNSKGRFLLNDFNRCRFIRWNQKEDKACKFHVGSNPGTFRSPEEYRYDLESEKVDIYSLGNVFYSIMMKEYPYEDISKKKAQKLIMDGKPPPIHANFTNSTDPFTRALVKATYMCWTLDPEKRATAREVEHFIDSELERLGVNGKQAA
ncbi:Putative serine/threonine-protein kinase/receptor [Seminavis robusta]|uniref:Serine/threonine-protein kinase/receptor n=1 Tax=Seminavis robusta TaxID=568900 RepID=A0A9N8D9B1_9STRA|nr:Putative serine/threonine-protein kinase/receptor [Seminavis robusta]|eukprot:Sro21_g015020.1 Putative serine/threonine-protein kinase/receptor (543) ;mRNA; f:165878-167592